MKNALPDIALIKGTLSKETGFVVVAILALEAPYRMVVHLAMRILHHVLCT
jgi:phenylalanine-4-hydroxylase